MIGLSTFLLLYAGMRDDPEIAIEIAWGVFVENFTIVIALGLIGFGIHFAFFSKTCPVCDGKLKRSAAECHHCGFNFDTAPNGRFRQMARSTPRMSENSPFHLEHKKNR